MTLVIPKVMTLWAMVAFPSGATMEVMFVVISEISQQLSDGLS